MSAFLGKAGKKLFEKHMEQYAPADPMYEYYTDDRGRQKRRKRELPPGLSARDAKILKAVKSRASRLDRGFSLCGLRFGWTFLIGLIPVVGDVADISLNYFFVVRKAKQAELPSWLINRMLFNNVVSGAIGFMPFVGDVMLAVYKANSRNAALLEEFLRIRGEEFIKIRAEGGDPDKIQKENAKARKREKAKGKGRRKGKDGDKAVKSKQIAPGVTKRDAEQVKPGAGREKGENVVPGDAGTGNMPGGMNSVTASGVNANGLAPGTSSSSPGSAGSRTSRSSGKSFGSRNFGFMSSWGRKSSPEGNGSAPPMATRNRGSRFFEDIDGLITKRE